MTEADETFKYINKFGCSFLSWSSVFCEQEFMIIFHCVFSLKADSVSVEYVENEIVRTQEKLFNLKRLHYGFKKNKTPETCEVEIKV